MTFADNYLNFWFKYVFPNKTELESGNSEKVLNEIKQDYNVYLGHSFEQEATEFLWLRDFFPDWPSPLQ